MTIEKAINRIAERTFDNTKNIRQMKRQRRNQVVDIYGTEFTRQGGPGAPATFYISISPDMIYLERFEFKLIIQPFLTTTGTSTGGTAAETEETSIIPSDYVTVVGNDLQFSHDTVIDPHKHSISNHGHSISPGATQTPVANADFLVSIEDIDVTPYLMAQYGTWISGEGVYPSININEDYDILEVASDFIAEHRPEDADKLTRSGYKKVEITGSKLFSVTLVLYCKYSHMNR